MPILELTSKERSDLRAAAHPLKPVVQIGDNGLTENVLKEIDHSLTAHSLIKVKIAGDDRQARLDMLHTICEQLSCANVNHLGKTLILYRPGDTQIAIAQKFDEFAPENQRSYRKPGEVYTPKKRAAEGKSGRKPRSVSARSISNKDLAKLHQGKKSNGPRQLGERFPTARITSDAIQAGTRPSTRSTRASSSTTSNTTLRRSSATNTSQRKGSALTLRGGMRGRRSGSR